MTTWTVDGAEYFPADETCAPAPGAQEHTLDILSPPLTSHSLSPEQVDERFETTLSEDIERRGEVRSVSSSTEDLQPFSALR